MRKMAFVIALMAVAMHAAAIGYATKRLATMASAIGAGNDMGLSIDSCTEAKLSWRGKTVRVCMGHYGDIDHIGYELFGDNLIYSPEQKHLLRFVERYLLELDMCLDGRSPAERMALDGVALVSGTVAQLRTVGPGTPFSIETRERRAYRITWTTGGGQTVAMSFPCDAQLLLGASLTELTANMGRDMHREAYVLPPLPHWQQAPASSSGNTLVVSGNSFIVEGLRNDLYLTQQNGKRRLIFSPKMPSRSVSNMMLTGESPRPLTIRLAIANTNRTADTTSVSLKQLVHSLLLEGAKLYFGTKNTSEQCVNGTLLAYHAPLGLCHVVSVSVPTAVINGNAYTITATLYAYIPLHNVTENFFDPQLRK